MTATASRTSGRVDPGPVRPGAAPASAMAWLGIAGAAVAAVLVAILHLLPSSAEISPLRRTLSEYALTESGWMFNVAALALAVGSLGVLASLVLTGRGRQRPLGVLLGGLWVAALTIVVVFPKHNWAIGPSTGGHIHRAASVVAFLCLPVAVVLLTRRGRGDPPRDRFAAAASWFALAGLAWLGLLIGAWALSPVTGVPWYRAFPLGVVERGLVLAEVAAVVALALWAVRRARARGRTAALSGPTRSTGPAG